jgi:hypothetical protein
VGFWLLRWTGLPVDAWERSRSPPIPMPIPAVISPSPYHRLGRGACLWVLFCFVRQGRAPSQKQKQRQRQEAEAQRRPGKVPRPPCDTQKVPRDTSLTFPSPVSFCRTAPRQHQCTTARPHNVVVGPAGKERAGLRYVPFLPPPTSMFFASLCPLHLSQSHHVTLISHRASLVFHLCFFACPAPHTPDPRRTSHRRPE